MKSAPLPLPKPQTTKPASVWQQLFSSCANLSIRSKLSLLLISGAAVPVIAVTQGMVWFSQQQAKQSLEETLRTRSTSWVNDYILWYKAESATQAYSIAKTLEASKINLQNPQSVDFNRSLLQFLVSATPQEKSRPDAAKSLRIITDAQGKVVAQYVQNQADYSLGETPSSEGIFQQASLPAGVNLRDIPIVKNSLQTGRSLSGVELLEGRFMQKLGLAKQATITPQPQSKQNLSQSEQPLPEGTYPEVDRGTAGLMSLAVQPIKVQGQLVGFVLVGQLLSKHNSLVDTFNSYYNTATSIFAQDLRVSTTIPEGNSKKRGLGTRLGREVAEVVLKQGKEYFGEADIQGHKYLTAYSPLYDHQQELNPKQAKPVGVAFVGITPETVEATLGKLQLVGYSIGGGILLLAAIVAVPVASTFSRPIKRLAKFAKSVGDGEKGMRLEATARQDEIGILSQELNQMVVSIEANLQARQQEAEQLRIIKDITVKLSQFPKVDGILNTAVEEIRLALQADRVVVYGFNEVWQGTIISESVADNWPRALGAQIDDPCFAERYVERYRQGRVQATENIHTAGLNKCYLKQLEAFAVQANLVAPIVMGERELLGLLIAHQCSGPRAWQQSEIELFSQLATQVGFALDRANLLEQQKTAKEQLQKRALELLMEVDPVSRGDLTIRANVTEDEIGTIADSYNSTIANLRKIVTQVQTAATKVATTTSTNENSVSELSQEALRQAQEIASALERIQEISHSIQDVANSAEQAEVTVQQAAQTVATGEAAMSRTVAGMLSIRATVAETSKKVKRLGESSQKISKVVNLISAFADQTNLLALNAAIEAANAGEQGRGFAVVADRVRGLARQSTEATIEIEKLVTDIQSETNEVVAAMEEGTEQVVTGTKLLDETRQSLNKIADASIQINDLIKVIASATVAQSQASVEVTHTISDVAQIANKTSTAVTQVSESFQELLTVATELQASASQFKVM